MCVESFYNLLRLGKVQLIKYHGGKGRRVGKGRGRVELSEMILAFKPSLKTVLI